MNNNVEEMWRDPDPEDLLEKQKFWDIRAEEYNLNHQNEKQDLVQKLFNKGVITKEARVLDIGCGPGKYLTEFAKISNYVTGIDISPNMIKYSKRNAESMNLNNVEFDVTPWEDLDINKYKWNKKFDFVFANMSPAISSKESLIKMNEVSKKYCFMSCFVYRKDKIRDELFENIIGKKNNIQPEKKVNFTFNTLWNMGIYPEITYEDVVWTNTINIKTAIEMYSMLLHKMDKNNKSIKDNVKTFLEKISKDGKIEEVIEAKIARLLWRVDE